MLETLFVSEDVYSQAEIEEAVEATTLKDTELELAHQIIDGLTGDFDPASLVSTYRRDLRALLDAKLSGAEPATPEPVAERAPAADLLEVLKASVAAAKGAQAKPSAKAKPRPAGRPARSTRSR